MNIKYQKIWLTSTSIDFGAFRSPTGLQEDGLKVFDALGGI